MDRTVQGNDGAEHEEKLKYEFKSRIRTSRSGESLGGCGRG